MERPRDTLQLYEEENVPTASGPKVGLQISPALALILTTTA